MIHKQTLRFFICVIVVSFITSCTRNKEQADFTQKPSGILYKLITIGDSTYTPQLGDSLYMNLIFKNDSGAIVFNSFTDSYNGVVGALMKKKIKYGTLDECYSMMSQGDSAHFKLNANVVYKNAFNISLPHNVKDNSLLTVEAKLIKVKTKSQLKTDSISYNLWCKEMKSTEDALLTEYLHNFALKIQPDPYNILFFNKNIQNNSNQQKTIFVHYKGRFLNGKVFDNTFLRAQPLEYKKETPDQVIKGLEIVLSKMNAGDKTSVIIPSELAFGPYGSSTGIVPPFATVIYDIEVIK